MFFHKTELLNTYSEEQFKDALHVLDEHKIKYEKKVVPIKEQKEKQFRYYIYVREREKERIYKVVRQELESFAY